MLARSLLAQLLKARVLTTIDEQAVLKKAAEWQRRVVEAAADVPA